MQIGILNILIKTQFLAVCFIFYTLFTLLALPICKYHNENRDGRKRSKINLSQDCTERLNGGPVWATMAEVPTPPEAPQTQQSRWFKLHSPPDQILDFFLDFKKKKKSALSYS